MRIYEYAKKINKQSKELIAFLKERGFEVKSHMSQISQEQIDLIEKEFAVEKRESSTKEEDTKTKVNKSITDKELKSAKIAKSGIENIFGDEMKESELTEEERIQQEYETLFEEEEEKRFRKSLKKHKAHHKEKEKDYAKRQEQKTKPISEGKIFEVPHNASVKEFATSIGMEPNELIAKLFSLGVAATINQTLDDDTIEIIAHELGIEIKFKEEDDKKIVEKADFSLLEDESEINMEPRPPVVTFMGHVDHGKTSLLDKVRNSNIAQKEAGGITQHIGASSVETPKGRIVFLDTPGHEAFTAMRAMGANITDIVVLVIAADDGIMPQTEEAINHAKEAEVPIIVAINKIDKPEANPELVKRQLAERGLTPEEWGGDTICVNVSALTGEGIDNLLEMILLQAEILELKANSKGQTIGIIIESEINDKIGPMATVIVKNGTLKKGDPVICGQYYGKIKKMFNDKGEVVDSAGPSTPVKIIGLNGAPDAGTQLRVVDSEKTARELSLKEQEKIRLKQLEKKNVVTLETIYSQIEEGKKKDLKIVLKADVSGSVHALSSALLKLKSDKINIKIIHSGTGSINDSDIMLADASKAIVVGFHVNILPTASELAKRRQVDVRIYDVIYTAIDEIKKAMEGLLEPEIYEENIGKAEVKMRFKVAKSFVAGCVVLEGKVTANAFVRVIRGSEVVANECKIASLKHYKEDVKEVKAGNECGIKLENFDEFKEGDIFEVFEKVQKKVIL